MREARLDWPAAVPLWMFSVCVRVSKWGSGAAASEATSTQTEDKQSAGKKKPRRSSRQRPGTRAGLRMRD